MTDLPSGTVTFLFTDIEGSTAHWERDPGAMRAAVDRHFALLQNAITAHGGVLFKRVGDAVHAAFTSAPTALRAAVAAQQALITEPWALPEPLRVRMALHTGEATPVAGDYAAPVLNRLARLLAVGHGGQVLLSAATQHLVRDALPPSTELRDFGEHRLRDLQPERIFQLIAPDVPTDFPPLRTLEHHPNNLPAPLTSFVGRERDITAVRDLVDDQTVRLVTLTGPGGVGKTRLAVRAAAGLLEAFPDGLFFVALAPLSDPALVVSTIASVLGVREEGARPLWERLAAFLRERRLLLILDNVEHLLEEAPQVSELLMAAPGLTVLATSRTRLRLQGEREVIVPPLATPDPDQGQLTSDDVTEYAAVRLFITRAREAQSGFSLTAENATTVAAICARLDGLPLAIELAAARVKLLPARALLARLEHRLSLLTGGTRDLPARQQTLRATIAWSYDLLTAEEQALLRRLAVFAGGWTFESAEAVVNPDGELGLDTLEGIGTLVDESLVQVMETAEGDPRYRMLETIREFVAERLGESAEEHAIRERHAAWCLALIDEVEQNLRGSDQREWLLRFDTELDNVRAAFDWLRACPDVESTQRCAADSWMSLNILGRIAEGRAWVERALALGDATHSAAYVRVLFMAVLTDLKFGDVARAKARADAAVTLARASNDPLLLGQALIHLGQAEAAQLEPIHPEQDRVMEALRVLQAANPRHWLVAAALGILAKHAIKEGDFARADLFSEQALRLRRELGGPWGIADALMIHGSVALRRGDLRRAKTLLRESIALSWDLGDAGHLSDRLVAFGQLALTDRQFAVAARLFGAAAALRARIGLVFPPAGQPELAEDLAQVRDLLGADAFAVAWAAGQTMPVQEVVAEALRFTRRGEDAPPRRLCRLSRRSGA